MEEFCNKIGIIEQGELIVAGDVNTIARQVRGQHNIDIAIVDELPRAKAILEGMSDVIKEVKVSSGLRRDKSADDTAVDASSQLLQKVDLPGRGGVLQIGYIGEPDCEYLVLQTLIQSGVKVKAFYTPETDLEDVFLRVTKGHVA